MNDHDRDRKARKDRFTADVHELVLKHRALGTDSEVLAASLLQVASALVLSEGVSSEHEFAEGAKIAFVAVRKVVRSGGVQA